MLWLSCLYLVTAQASAFQHVLLLARHLEHKGINVYATKGTHEIPGINGPVEHLRGGGGEVHLNPSMYV